MPCCEWSITSNRELVSLEVVIRLQPYSLGAGLEARCTKYCYILHHYNQHGGVKNMIGEH